MDGSPAPHSGHLRLRRSRRRRLFRVASLGVLPALFLIAEGLVRWLLPPVPVLQLFVREANPEIETKIGARIFEGDPLVGWKLKPNLVDALWDYTVFSTDRDGWRNPRSVRPRRAGVGRMLCVGDSVTFGYRVPVAWPEDPGKHDSRERPFPRLLETMLARIAGPTEVISMATPGHSSHQGLALLHREIARIDPDLVILCFGWNDVDIRPMADKDSLPVDVPHVIARTACSWSQALTRLTLMLHRQHDRPAPAGPVALVPRVSSDDFVRNMLGMARLATEHGARTMILGPAYRDRSYPEEADRIAAWRRTLAAEARAAGVPYLEIPELTEDGSPANAPLFGERIHPGSLGHRLMADRLCAFISGNNLYPPEP